MSKVKRDLRVATIMKSSLWKLLLQVLQRCTGHLAGHGKWWKRLVIDILRHLKLNIGTQTERPWNARIISQLYCHPSKNWPRQANLFSTEVSIQVPASILPISTDSRQPFSTRIPPQASGNFLSLEGIIIASPENMAMKSHEGQAVIGRTKNSCVVCKMWDREWECVLV